MAKDGEKSASAKQQRVRSPRKTQPQTPILGPSGSDMDKIKSTVAIYASNKSHSVHSSPNLSAKKSSSPSTFQLSQVTQSTSSTATISTNSVHSLNCKKRGKCSAVSTSTLSSLSSTRRAYHPKAKQVIADSSSASAQAKNGRWSLVEHLRFLEALKLYNKNWKMIEEHIATRTSTQARSHAQKFFGNIQKSKMTMEQYLERVSIERIEEIRQKIASRATSKVASKSDRRRQQESNSDLDDLREENWEFLMIHTSKRIDDTCVSTSRDHPQKLSPNSEHLSTNISSRHSLSEDSLINGEEDVDSGAPRRMSKRRKLSFKRASSAEEEKHGPGQEVEISNQSEPLEICSEVESDTNVQQQEVIQESCTELQEPSDSCPENENQNQQSSHSNEESSSCPEQYQSEPLGGFQEHGELWIQNPMPYTQFGSHDYPNFDNNGTAAESHHHYDNFITSKAPTIAYPSFMALSGVSMMPPNYHHSYTTMVRERRESIDSMRHQHQSTNLVCSSAISHEFQTPSTIQQHHHQLFANSTTLLPPLPLNEMTEQERFGSSLFMRAGFRGSRCTSFDVNDCLTTPVGPRESSKVEESLDIQTGLLSNSKSFFNHNSQSSYHHHVAYYSSSLFKKPSLNVQIHHNNL